MPTPRPMNAYRILVLGAAFVAWVQFARLPLEEQVTFVPDDGFYYLNVGANRASIGVWSFDHGISKTTGFHLLHAHVCALLAPLFSIDDTHALLGVHTLIAYALTAYAALLLGQLAASAFGLGALPGALIALGTGAALSCPRMLMEWPWVLSLYAIFLNAAARARWRTACVAAFILPLARSDAIVAVLATLIVFAGATWRRERKLRSLQPAAVCAASCVAGVVAVSAFVFVQSGYFVQGNARMKAFLSGRGVSPGRIVGVVTRAFAPAFWQIETPRAFGATLFWAETLFFGVLVVGVGIALHLRRSTPHVRPVITPALEDRLAFEGRVVLVAAIASTVATTTLYALKVRAVMPWYCVYTIGPAALALGAGSAWLCRGRALAAGFGAAACMMAIGIGMARVPIWPHQSSALAGGQWLREHPELAPGAAINAGIAGYFSDSKVVNLDGLVNDDIHPYYFAKKVECYLVDKRINVIIDQDCTGRPDAQLSSQEDFSAATSTMVDFGRTAGEPHCDVRAWRVDRSVYSATCP